MKKLNMVLIVFSSLLFSCSNRDAAKPTPRQIVHDPLQVLSCAANGIDDEIEVVTWNLERFPLNGKKTVAEVKKLIQAIDMDLFAIQEIKDIASFNDLLAELPHHKGFHGANQYIRLGFVYDTRDLELLGKPLEIFQDRGSEFPRAPLMARFRHKKLGIELTAINLHLKCCGGNENRERRARAMNLLKTYLDDNHSNQNLVILGDFNEHLSGALQESNIYYTFIRDNHYEVTTLDLLGNSDDWSYPSWLSQLDQIIISRDFVQTHRQTKSMALDKCDPRYTDLVSDHRPVFVRITD